MFLQGFLLRSLVRSEHVLPVAFFVLCFCFLPISVASDEENMYEWDADQYPNLAKEPKFCTGPKRNPPSAICDPDAVLTKQEALDLDKLIESNENVTTCLCDPCPPNKKGLSIKVAILMSVKKRNNQTLEETIEQFADRTRSNWNFSPLCQHDLVIFVANTYNKVFISQGSKADRVIGTSTAKDIISGTLNHFKFGHTYQGLESIILSLKNEARNYDPRFDKFRLKHGLIITISAALGSLVFIIVVVWLCMRRESKRTKKIAAKGSGPRGSTTTANNANVEQQYQLVNNKENSKE